MSGSKGREARLGRASRALGAAVVAVAMLAASLVMVSLAVNLASARGPAYPGPQTEADGPAFFGPAPNPLPYCDNPTYFDPWDENVTPIGRLDVGDTAAVTTDGITMVLEIQNEGDPDGQYPGFFPFDGEGSANDRAKGFEVAPGDTASVSLSQPLFYAQFIFTDVDQPGEGFDVVPDWAVIGEVIAYGGDSEFTFEGTTNQRIVLDDVDGVGHSSESVSGRAQLDMLGAVNGITFTRPATRIDPDTGAEIAARGQSGLAVAGGCEASGAAKRVVAGPTWNGESFEVSYELRLRNNMPTEQTINEVVAAASANAQTTFSTAPPSSISLTDMRLQDQLADPAFETITVTDVSTTSPNLVLNDGYDGLSDDELLADGSFLAAESDAAISLTVEYAPEIERTEWADCSTGYDYFNQSQVFGTVGGIAVSDLSDDGVDPTPSADNGFGDVDDPTPVLFPCLPAGLDVVKTVVNGPNGTCPTFADGTRGEGPTLPVIVDDVVTYCISVANDGSGTATEVVVADTQAPASFDIGTLEAGQASTVSYNVQVGLATPELNTATATGASVLGDLGPVSDTARIAVSMQPDPVLEIVKTVVEGPGGTCPVFAQGVAGEGDALPVVYGDTVTYCIAVVNTGENDATGVTITDAQAPGVFSIGELAIGDSVSRSYDIVIDAATAELNTATVSGQGPNGDLPEVSDTARIDPSPQPDPILDIVKTVVDGPDGTCPEFAQGVAGDGDPLVVFYADTVTYCISVQNAGARDATEVVITDAQGPGDFAVGVLQIGETATVTYDVVVDANTDELNTATVRGQGPNGNLPEESDTALIDPTPQPDPQLTIVKTVVLGPSDACPRFEDGITGVGDALKVSLGDTVTYCISVRNTGARDAENVVIADEQAPQSYEIDTLAVGETADRSYDLVVDIDTPLVNVAVVNGNGPNGELPEDEDDAQINTADIELIHTVIRADRNCDDTLRDVDILVVDLEGLEVQWCYRIVNTGNVPLAEVVLSSPDIGFSDLDALLNDGGSFVIASSGDIESTLEGEAGALPASGNQSTASANAEPSLAILMPGESVTLEVRSKIPAGGLESVADVVAEPVDLDGNSLGFEPVTDVDEAEVREGQIQLDKTVAAGTDTDCASATEAIVVAPGDPVTWCFTVTNIGTLDLRVADIVDDTLGISVVVPEELRVLEPESSFTLWASGVSPGTIVNLASVEGLALDADGQVIAQAPVARDDDTAEIRPPQADLAIDKTVSDRGPVPLGTVLTYTLLVTNDGPDAATDVEVVDVLAAGLRYVALPGTDGWACSLDGARAFICSKSDDMASGETATLIYTVEVLSDAARGVELRNVATVDATTDDPDTTDNTDEETTRTDVPGDDIPSDPRPEYPGPFTVPDPPAEAPPELPDEVLGLAITGSSSRQLGLLSALMIMLGALLTVGSRRSRDHRID